MAKEESGESQVQRGAAADAQIDVIAARANAIASELLAASASIEEAGETGKLRASLVHRLNAAAANVQALAAPARQLRDLQRLS